MKAYAIKDPNGNLLPSTCSLLEDVPDYIFKSMTFDKDGFRKDLTYRRISELGLTLQEAADQMGLSKATINRIENRKGVDIDTFAIICTWMQKDPSTYFIVKI